MRVKGFYLGAGKELAFKRKKLEDSEEGNYLPW